MKEENQELYLAGQDKRLINFLADYIIYFLLCILVGSAIIIAAGDSAEKMATTRTFAYSLTFGVHFLYYCLMESFFGITIGKIITNTRVVDEWGNKPDFKTILIRTLCRLIPFEALSFLVLEVGWHDSFSGTRVILNSPSPLQKKANSNSTI